jgi:hypothetical protein
MMCIRQTLWRDKSSPLLKALKGRTSPEVSVCARAYFILLKERNQVGYKVCNGKATVLPDERGLTVFMGTVTWKWNALWSSIKGIKPPKPSVSSHQFSHNNMMVLASQLGFLISYEFPKIQVQICLRALVCSFGS